MYLTSATWHLAVGEEIKKMIKQRNRENTDLLFIQVIVL